MNGNVTVSLQATSYRPVYAELDRSFGVLLVRNYVYVFKDTGASVIWAAILRRQSYCSDCTRKKMNENKCLRQ